MDSIDTSHLNDLKRKIMEFVHNPDISLPILPRAVKGLFEFTYSPNASATELTDMIMKDPFIAFKVLSVVNAPGSSAALNYSSVSEAIDKIGLDRIKKIIISIWFQSEVFSTPQYKPIIDTLWAHSIGCAVISRDIGKLVKLEHDFTFLAGLLHDIGKPLILYILSKLPDSRTDLPMLSRPQFIEEELFSLHRFVGKIVGKKWKIHDAFIQVIEFHHKFELAEVSRELVAVVNLADQICHFLGVGTVKKDIKLEESSSYKYLQLNLGDIDQILTTAPLEIESILNTIH